MEVAFVVDGYTARLAVRVGNVLVAIGVAESISEIREIVLRLPSSFLFTRRPRSTSKAQSSVGGLMMVFWRADP